MQCNDWVVRLSDDHMMVKGFRVEVAARKQVSGEDHRVGTIRFRKAPLPTGDGSAIEAVLCHRYQSSSSLSTPTQRRRRCSQSMYCDDP